MISLYIPFLLFITISGVTSACRANFIRLPTNAYTVLLSLDRPLSGVACRIALSVFGVIPERDTLLRSFFAAY